MKKRDVLICGGGIGGLALAIRLKQLGLNPVVIERQKGIRPQPKGEYFQPQGVELLRRFGLLEAFLAKGATKIRVVSHTFREPLLKRLERFEVKYRDYDGIDYGLAALHEDILEILREQYAHLGGELIEGCFVRDLEDWGDAGYRVHLSDERVVDAQVFVGADGRFSATRKMIGLDPIELPCERFMMAALIENIALPEGEFYTEEIPGGVVYAFAYSDQTVRGYICFEKPDLPRANRDKAAFFLEKLQGTSIAGRKGATFKGPIMIMPTADMMLSQRTDGLAIWFGDAAGTVDPLGGHGMSVALNDADRIADAIHANLRQPPSKLRRALRSVSRRSRQDYLHARFLGIWIGLLFMGPRSQPMAEQRPPLESRESREPSQHLRAAARWGKWIATRKYRQDPELRDYLVDLFSGKNKDPFGLYDLPYLLGIFPGRMRKKLSRMKLNRILLKPQNEFLTTPLPFQKQRILDVLGSRFGLRNQE